MGHEYMGHERSPEPAILVIEEKSRSPPAKDAARDDNPTGEHSLSGQPSQSRSSKSLTLKDLRFKLVELRNAGSCTTFAYYTRRNFLTVAGEILVESTADQSPRWR